MDTETLSLNSAISDFYHARRQAHLEELLAKLTGKSAKLLSYDEVTQQLKTTGSSDRGLQDIPLAAIVGSVGRYNDFTRSFLPLHDDDMQRWANVQRAANSMVGLPPIEVYQVGQVYFVLDGNHRVSVARQMGATYIQAYVTEVRTVVPLTPDMQPDELIVKARYAHFLEQTGLDKLRPGVDLSVTALGQYRLLEEQIEQHQRQLNVTQQREVPFEEAVTSWYDQVYLPVVESIREQGILRDFPGRTETDLYVWLVQNLAELEKGLGWRLRPERAMPRLVTQLSPKPQHRAARMGEKLLDAVTPDPLESGPPAGQWRQTQAEPRAEIALFDDILVALSGEPGGWLALEYASLIAQREAGRLLGLHVTRSNEPGQEALLQAIRAQFEQHCQAAGVAGELAIEAGEVTRTICERAWWTDVVVVSLTYPPAPQLLARLGSGFRTLVRRCPRPLLAIPTAELAAAEPSADRLNRALLAYDGTPKAQEALFLATYLAGRWHIPLTVVTVSEKNEATLEIITQAYNYLADHGVAATYIIESGPVAENILKTAATHRSNLIIMGGYGLTPMLEVVLGSSVDQVLRQACQPLLICR
jgi:nucleotide-binding universal stress UspA family protein